MSRSLFGNWFKKDAQADSKAASEAEDWYDKGLNLFLQKSYEEAIRCCDKALRLNPAMVQAHTKKGECLEALGNQKEAVQCFNRALKFDPEDPQAWLQLGISADKTRNYQAALNYYEHYLIYAPPEHIRVIFYTMQRMHALGIADIPAAIHKTIDADEKAEALAGKRDPRRAASTWNKRGQCFLFQGKHADAIQCYDQSLKADPGLAAPWMGKGICLSSLGRYNEAIACFDQALAIDPGLVAVWWNKGEALKITGRYEDAILSYDQALIYDPDTVRAWLSKGECQEKLAQTKEAAQSYRMLLETARPEFKSEFEQARMRLQALEGDQVK